MTVSDTPLVWLLTDDRPGNRTQGLGVAEALGWAYVEKPLTFNELQSRSNARLGATLASLDDASRSLIAPPYPDLVIAAGRRVVPAARWIRQETEGCSKVVLVGRKTPDSGADLTIRPAYLKQAESSNLVELLLPLTQVGPETLAKARAETPDPLQRLASPKTLFLVGGPTGQHLFDDDFAERMAREIAEAVERLGGGLSILTSRRTPPSAVAAIRRGAPSADLNGWTPDAAFNPVLAGLARADLVVVTGESESMLAEAVASARPLTIYPLVPLPLNAKSRIRGWIADSAISGGLIGRLCARIMADGWVTPRRDLAEMHSLLETRGWGRVFDGALNTKAPAPYDERARLAARIRDAMGAPWRSN